MLSFREYMVEMAYRNGISGKSKKDIWDNVRNSSKMLADRLGSQHYKLYTHDSVYFLTDEGDEYIGHIQVWDRGNSLSIEDSFSILKDGFYSIMFPLLFNFANAKEILSDISMSNTSIKSYDNLNKNTNMKVRVINQDEKYLTFSIHNLLSNKYNRVSITESSVGFFKDIYEDYIARLERSHFKQLYENYDNNLDGYIFTSMVDHRKG